MKFLPMLMIFSYQAFAGCPAMGIQKATAKILSCTERKSLDGLVIEAIVSYANETMMAPPAAKDLKLLAFDYAQSKRSCKDFEAQKVYCLSLQKWCGMAGTPPHGANYTVGTSKLGKCP